MSRITLTGFCSILCIAACDDPALDVEFDAAEATTDAWATQDVDDEEGDDRAGNCATAFEHVGYDGSRLNINRGQTKWVGGPWNDHISSLKVKSGCVLNAYEHKALKGEHKAFQGNVPNVGSGWNDRISSYTCSC